jgi:hypothetical protein
VGHFKFSYPSFFLLSGEKEISFDAAKENPAVTDKSTGFIVLLLLAAAWVLYSYREILFN